MLISKEGTVNVLYNALMLKEKSTDKELFYRLIDSNIITTAKAIELGLIEKQMMKLVTKKMMMKRIS